MPQVTVFLISLLIIIAGGCLGYLLGGLYLALCISITLLVAIFLLVPIIKTRHNQFTVRHTVLLVFGEISLVIVRGESLIISLLNIGLHQLGLPEIPLTEYQDQALLLAISGTVIIALTLIIERRQILPLSPSVLDEEDTLFKKPDYKKLRNRFCKFMEGYLDRLDEETNWSDSYYEPLEAEIEIVGQSGKRSRVVADLIKAIRHDKKSPAFLLIGDPGLRQKCFITSLST